MFCLKPVDLNNALVSERTMPVDGLDSWPSINAPRVQSLFEKPLASTKGLKWIQLHE